MKKPLITKTNLLFSLCLFLCISACQDYNNSTKYPIEYQHGYDEHGHNHDNEKEEGSLSDLENIELDQNENPYTSKSRVKWLPQDIPLQLFGNLKDKTIADIGAGPEGYFTLYISEITNVKKILAIDIDQDALDFINAASVKLGENSQQRIETRLADPNNAKLKANEVDGIIISETLGYIEDKVGYLASLKTALKPGGKLVIVDLKRKKIPNFLLADGVVRIPLYKVEELIEQAGYKIARSDDMTLPFNYMLVCEKI